MASSVEDDVDPFGAGTKSSVAEMVFEPCEKVSGVVEASEV